MELNTIQQLIDERAESRLKKDLDSMRNTIMNIPVLSVTESGFPQMGFKGKETSPYWFFNNDNNKPDCYYKALYDYWLPKYKSEEAKLFLEKVDDLSKDVKNLMNTEFTDY